MQKSVEYEKLMNRIKEEYQSYVGKKIIFIFSCISLNFLIAGISATLGSYHLTIGEVYSIIWLGTLKIIQNLNFIFSSGIEEFLNSFSKEEKVIWALRLPRILMGILTGASLAIAGVVMQSILRNPLASPYTLGISASAGFGASVAIIYGTGLISWISLKYLIIANAFLFSLIPVFVILVVTRIKGTTPETMILAGIAMTYIFHGYLQLVYYFSEAEAMKEAYFWLVGSLGRASWDNIPLNFLIFCLCFLLLFGKSWDLNAMQLGDEVAKSLGVDVERMRILILLIASFLTASVVSFVGTIGFIGLIAPHVCRIFIGGDNRYLIPASAFFGSAFLLAMDTIGRTIIAPVIIPVGVIMDCIGGPFFFYILMRRRREYW
ncbi:MAG: iron ABC transporter permease [Archaeoglobaceae archaeon]|nr:iron ABC transporter permease [Archaeoglobaceae archaeon]